MLQGMARQLKNDQAKTDKLHNSFRGRCKFDVEFYHKEIANARKQISSLRAELSVARPSLVRSRDSLRKEKAIRSKLEKQLASAVRLRAKEAREYKRKVAEHERAILAVSEARKMFSGLLKGSSFIQQGATVFAQVSSQFESARNEIESVGYKALFGILSEIANKAQKHQVSAAIVHKIVKLCNKIIDALNESYRVEKRAEKSRSSAFNALRKNLQKALLVSQSAFTKF
jgi:hypothetical protein